MKLPLMLLLLLSMGCSNLVFDGIQFDRYVSLYEQSQDLLELCNKPESSLVLRNGILDLKEHTEHMALYSDLRSNAPEVRTVTETLASMTNELADRYRTTTPSSAYCVQKLQNIKDAARTVSATLGAQ
jgi:hypothetical protein